MDKSLFECKKFVTSSIFIKKALDLHLSLEEFIMLTYFDNDYNSFLNIESVSENIGLSLDEAYKIFNSLVSKKLITIESTKDLEGRMIERVSLANFYDMVCEEKTIKEKETKKTDIYSKFENEFGRTISSIEYEIINAWLEKGYNEDLIEGALKEAVYNGVKNLRYIDKILYEWGKKGFKSMNDVSHHLENREKKTERKDLNDLLNYNWLEEDE